MSASEKNVFISHYGKDDEHIAKLKSLLSDNGYILKNSSIDSSKPNDASNPEYIKSLLRDRIRWAGTTMVLIGEKTHTREWVNWEIEQANQMGKRIVGVFLNGASDSDVPEAFKKFGNALVGWTSEKIIDAIEGRCSDFERADGSPWQNSYGPTFGNC